VRERSRRLFERALGDASEHFVVRPERLARAADYVLATTRHASLRPGGHGREQHFQAGGRDRLGELEAALAGSSVEQAARAAIDLVVTSVLLDAGAGDRWAFRDGDASLARSEGLAVASFRWIVGGGLSHDGRSVRVDAEGLARVEERTLGEAFQSTPQNPLVGVAGRAAMLSRLAAALRAHPSLFGPDARPGGLFDALASRARDRSIHASTALEIVLEGLATVWPSGTSLRGEPLGDAFAHPALGDRASASAVVPFHKLAQWLVRSLAGPLRRGGLELVGVEELSGLAEYRTGGLFLDLGVIEVREPRLVAARHAVGDPFVVEWRALTVSLLDELGAHCGGRMDPSDATEAAWRAGRRIAAELRAGGGSPIAVESDGTLF
jgi:hypothetical protein